jgi:hypothetical protein
MPYKIWVQEKRATIRSAYTKTGTTPPVATYTLTSGSTSIFNINSDSTTTHIVKAPCPLTASVILNAQTFPTAKTVTISLIVKNITDNTTLSTQGPTGFTTTGTGFTYQWLGLIDKVYEVTGSASNT